MAHNDRVVDGSCRANQRTRWLLLRLCSILATHAVPYQLLCIEHPVVEVMRSDQVPVDSELLPFHLYLDVPAALWNRPTSCSSCTGLARRPVRASLTPLVEVRTTTRGTVCSTLAKAGTRLLM